MFSRKPVVYDVLLSPSAHNMFPKSHRDLHAYNTGPGARPSGMGVVQVGNVLYRQDIEALMAMSPTIANLVGGRRIHHFSHARPLVIPGLSSADFENWMLVHFPYYDWVQEGHRTVRRRRLLRDYPSFQRASAILRSTVEPHLLPLQEQVPPPLPPKDRRYFPAPPIQISRSKTGIRGDRSRCGY
ncbi:hypothetical protein FA13DRAFT_643660 [Coprinellus micaceus]|uniref:Uncharacterized protein n=1 Tax=Coprinellus micaceus TaxID=71717 RepID=A0A4Y7T613_COPMI|nr:hypothetical protein FA13DRAFT_643660 [Coprinellus micaceus]